MKQLDPGLRKDFFNTLIYWVARPYALVLALLILLTPSVWFAHALESGADFLNIGAGARAAAMGSAYTSVSGDLNSVHYNPAGLAGVKRSMSFTHADWIMDGNYNFMAVALPFKTWNSAVSYTRLDYGSFDARGAGGEAIGGFRAVDSSLGFAAARSVGGGLSLGAGGKFLFSSIAGYSASAFAFDLGAAQKLSGSPVSFGLAVRNLGSGMKFASERDSLPLNVTAGMNVQVLPAMNIVLDVKRMVREKRTDFSIGTEYGLMGAMSLRSGYYANTGSQAASLNGLSGGLGVTLADMQLDYSFTPFAGLDSVNRFSMSYKF